MIVNELYKGQGLGNQLWNYVVARIIAEKNNCGFSIIGQEKFKGKNFIEIDFGKKIFGGYSPEGGPPFSLPKGIKNYYREKKEVLQKDGFDISRTDQDLLKIKPFTKFDGNCQSTKYINGHEDKIKEWIKIKPIKNSFIINENTCIIHVRGGDFKKTNTVLPKSYYENAIAYIKKINPSAEFFCVTDDKEFTKKILPNIRIIGSAEEEKQDKNKAKHHMGGPIEIDFNLLLQAPYIIIPHSSFSWWAAYLNKNKKIVIAPKYWARFNMDDGFWSTFDITTPGFTYLDKSGNIINYNECVKEKEIFEKNNINMFSFDKQNLSILSIKKIIVKIKDKIIYKLKTLKTGTYSKIKTIFSKKISKNDIKNYRKNIKIYDIFTYNGEADVLEIRFNILKDAVDQFIIVEAPTTFSGNRKPLYFEKQKDRFKIFLNKIRYFVINDYPNDAEILRLADKSSSVPKDGPEHWRREFYQKESIKNALTDINDDDFCFVSDVDEIWNPDTIINYKSEDIFKLKQKVYTYFLNNSSNEPWAGTMATKYKNIRLNSLNDLRNKSLTNYTYIRDAGWHFTNIGGLEEIKRKLEDSYDKESYNTEEVQTKLKERFGKEDYIGRRYKYKIDEKNLPKYLLDYKHKYKKLFK